jgi:hypothetical protein
LLSSNSYAPAKKILDEASKQLLEHLYPPVAIAPGQDKKEDYHYTREGVQALFAVF